MLTLCQERVSVRLIVRTHPRHIYRVVNLSLKPVYSHPEELVLPLGLEHLLLQEVSFLLYVVGLALPLLLFFLHLVLLFLHPNLVVSDALDRLL